MSPSCIHRVSAACYKSIVDDFAVVACAHMSENELGAAAFATNSLLAPRPANSFQQERLERSVLAFGGQPPSSTFRAERTGLVQYSGWLDATSSSSSFIIHEGYMVDPRAEASDDLERLRDILGDRLWASTPEVWHAWGNKAEFRQRCREILGERSLPPGIEFTAVGASDIAAAIRAFGPGDSGIRIVKVPGIGGQGNLVLAPANRESWSQRVERLWGRSVCNSQDVVIEHWLPWEATYSVSFLVPPGGDPQPIAVCEQMVDKDLGRFVGSRNDLRLSDADIEAMLTWLLALFERMGRDGYAGIAAIDVIVSSAEKWGGHGYRLPSGQAVSVIECNPRFNRHNRVGLLIERLARSWELDSGDLLWTLRDVYPADGVSLYALVAQLEKAGASRTLQSQRPPTTPVQKQLFIDRRDRVMELSIVRH